MTGFPEDERDHAAAERESRLVLEPGYIVSPSSLSLSLYLQILLLQVLSFPLGKLRSCLDIPSIEPA